MILGLLYASFKISNIFSSMASGINFGSLATGALSAATGGVAGFALRNTVGRGANAINERMTSGAKKLYNSDNVLARGIGRTLYTGAQPFKAAASNKSLGDFQGNVKRRGEALGKKADNLTLSKDEKEKIRNEADQKTIAKNPHLKEEKAAADKAVGAAETNLANVKNDPGLKKTLEEATKNISSMQAKYEEAQRTGGDAASAKANLDRQVNEQKRMLNEQDDKISRAKDELETAKRAQTAVGSTIRQMTNATGGIKVNMERTKAQNVAYLGESYSTTFKRAIGLKPPQDNNRIIRAGQEHVEKQSKADKRKKAAEALADEGDKPEAPATAAEAPTPAATPAAAAPHVEPPPTAHP
jgi:hypothetical protein